jgi:hypothetical protein
LNNISSLLVGYVVLRTITKSVEIQRAVTLVHNIKRWGRAYMYSKQKKRRKKTNSERRRLRM